MTDTLHAPPAQIRAGDTVKWHRSIGGYAAGDGWQLTYYLVSDSARITFSSSASGNDHAVTVPAGVTASWAAGSYQLQECAVKGSERYTLLTSRMDVLPDLATATEGLDTRSHARKVLDAINAWIEGRANWAGEVTYAGRSIKQIPIQELLQLQGTYKARVMAEEAKDRAAKGLPFGNRVLVRL